MRCEVCKQGKATSFVNKKNVCRDCFEELKQNKHLRIRKGIYSYKCVTCEKSFESKCKLIIPFCSRNCRDKHKRMIDKDIVAENKESTREFIQEINLIKASKGGVEII